VTSHDLSWLLTLLLALLLTLLLASHPLQVRAGYNQLIPLFVTMTDRELFHALR
jgi:hypothetical protein